MLEGSRKCKKVQECSGILKKVKKAEECAKGSRRFGSIIKTGRMFYKV